MFRHLSEAPSPASAHLLFLLLDPPLHPIPHFRSRRQALAVHPACPPLVHLFLHPAHHSSHLLELGNELHGALERVSASCGDPPEPIPRRPVLDEKFGILFFFFGHGVDHVTAPRQARLHVVHFGGVRHARDAGNHLGDARKASHLADELRLREEVVEIEGRVLHLRGHALGVRVGHLRGGLLHEGHHVTHAEDASGHAVRVEGLEVLHLLARPDEFDGPPRDSPDGHGRTPPAVAVEFREDRPREAHRGVEGGRQRGRLLSRHGVHHEQRLVRRDRGLDVFELPHEVRVDDLAARRVDEHRVVPLRGRLGHRRHADLDGVRVRAHVEHVHAHLLPQYFQLGDGGRPVHIGGHQQHLPPHRLHPRREPDGLLRPLLLRGGGVVVVHLALLEVQRQFPRRRGLPGALKARQQHHRRTVPALPRKGGGRRAAAARERIPAHQVQELVVHGLHELLVGTHARRHRGAQDARPHALDQRVGHLHVHVGVQQVAPDLAEGALDALLRDIFRGERVLDRRRQAGREAVEHHVQRRRGAASPGRRPGGHGQGGAGRRNGERAAPEDGGDEGSDARGSARGEDEERGRDGQPHLRRCVTNDGRTSFQFLGGKNTETIFFPL
mmetsp:Transcript_7125/g.14853  ORF Transcript_7125/g.14853 Transcript_7125/m.14853 type:complete len:613 (-) Transcript_7125:9-1847(-)